MPTSTNKPWENALLGVVAGSARTTQGIAGGIAEAYKIIKKNASLRENEAKPYFNYRDIPQKIWDALTKDQKAQAIQNSQSHSKQLLPLIDPINAQAERVYSEAKTTADTIKENLPAQYQPIRMATEAIPSLLLAGRGPYRTAANLAQGLFNQIGQDRSIDPASIAPVLAVPGNSAKSIMFGQALQEIVPPVKHGIADIYQKARRKAKTLVVR